MFIRNIVVFMAGMMRYLNLVLLASSAILFLGAATAASDDISNLKKLISASNDPSMNAQDLAFFLATHNYGVTPKGIFVELKLDGQTYRILPNGQGSEICNMRL